MRIGILTPAYDGKLHRGYHDGVLQAAAWCWSNGHELFTIVLPGNALIDKARNEILHKARALDLDEYVFIDSDVGFTGDQFARLLSHDVPLVGGAYRYKKDDESYPVALVEGGATYQGLIEAKYVPGGFMRIRRDALAKMIVAYQKTNECLYNTKEGIIKVLHLFEMGRANLGDGTPSYVGEDVHFCNLWRLLGEKVWLDPDIKLSHTGEKTWDGDYAAYYKSLGAQTTEKQGE
jgi:hypothetical protein